MSLQRFRSSCLKFTDVQMTHSMTWWRHIVGHQVTVLICFSCLNHWPNSRTPTRLASSPTKLPGQKRSGHVLVWIFLVFCYHYLAMFCVNKILISEISVPWVFIAYVLYLFLLCILQIAVGQFISLADGFFGLYWQSLTTFIAWQSSRSWLLWWCKRWKQTAVVGELT